MSYVDLARQAATRSREAPGPSQATDAQPALSDLLSMSLLEFARAASLLEVRVPWWPDTLFFVPAARDVAALQREGVSTERVWTAKELLALLSGPPPTAEALRVIMIARRELGGEVVEARARSD